MKNFFLIPLRADSAIMRKLGYLISLGKLVMSLHAEKKGIGPKRIINGRRKRERERK